MKTLREIADELIASVRGPSYETEFARITREVAVHMTKVNANIRRLEAEIEIAEFRVLTDDELCDDEGNEVVFPLQQFAALEVFQAFFVESEPNAWVHLAALMQAGKTGVVYALLQLIQKNKKIVKFPFDRTFVVTGMSDNAWREQTVESMPDSRKVTVEHNGGLARVQAKLRSLRKEDKQLSNVLIVMDESHIACSKDNRPSGVLETVKELCPPDFWVENNIRVLTISATDPARFIDIYHGRPLVRSKVVHLDVSAAQLSIEQLEMQGRLQQIEDVGELHDPKVMDELVDFMHRFYPTPRQHFFRPRLVRKPGQPSPFEVVRRLLDDRGIKQHICDAQSKPEPRAKSDSGSINSRQDINNLLREAPAEHTVILLRNMFQAAKRLHDEHAGIFFDRIGMKDDTNLQSLLGRACGQGKSRDTVVFTSKRTVFNQTRCWSQAMRAGGVFKPDEIDSAGLNRRMPGVVGLGLGLGTAPEVAVPGGEDSDYEAPEREHAAFAVHLIAVTSTIKEAIARANLWKRDPENELPEEVRKTAFDGRTERAIEMHKDGDKQITDLGNKKRVVRTIAEMNTAQGLSMKSHWARLQPCQNAEGALFLALRQLTESE